MANKKETKAVKENVEPKNETAVQESEAAKIMAGSKAAQEAFNKKITDEQAEEIVAKLNTTHLNHRCAAVPFNTAEWVPGTIVAIRRDKNRNTITLAIKLDDGRNILKAYDSKLVKVSAETVEPSVRRTRAASTERLTEEQLDELCASMVEHVGQFGSLPDGTKHFRIVGILRESRGMRAYYKVEYTETGKAGYKAPTGITFGDWDEDGKQLHDKFVARQPGNLTPEERLKRAEDAVKAAEATIEKAKANLEERKAKLEALKAKLAEQTAEQPAKPADETEQNDEDLL